MPRCFEWYAVLCGQVAGAKQAVTAMKATIERECLHARIADADHEEPAHSRSIYDDTDELLVQLERVSLFDLLYLKDPGIDLSMLLSALKVGTASRRRPRTGRQVVS